MKKTLWNTGWGVAPGVPNPFGVIFGSEPEPQPVMLPQDAMILEKRDPGAPSGNQTGYYPVKSYTYEKRFFVPEAWRNLCNILEFEGVMAQSMVYLNGELIASNHYGYSQFLAPLDRHLRYGEENVLQVIARSQENASRWYPGAGIYRDVWLHQGALLHLCPEGVRLFTREICDGYALVTADLCLANDSREACTCTVRLTLTAPDGVSITAENKVSLLCGEDTMPHMQLTVDAPQLWSPDGPALYHYHAAILRDGEEIDRAEGSFGIRTLSLDARQGLRINGVETKLRGACIHHDNGIIGATTLPDAEYHRLRQMKAAGFNTIRSAHHPAGPALLDACDCLGILVMDEMSDMWEMPKNSADYALDFVDEWRVTMERMVAKDWNHPSVVLYCLGNEIPEIGRRSGGRRNREMAQALRQMDPSRYVTCAISGFLAMTDRIGEMTAQMQAVETADIAMLGSEALNAAMNKMEQRKKDAFSVSTGLSEAMEEAACELDVVGYNYLTARHTWEHHLHPERVVVGSETYPTEIARLWEIARSHPHVIGDFTWTGYDYVGEAGLAVFHYQPERKEQGWYPDRLSYCGDIDLNGRRRPVSYLREIAFGLRKEPYIAVERVDRHGQPDNTNDWKYYDAVGSWTWPGYEGKPAVVHVLSDADEVCLYLNGQSLGSKPVGAEEPLTASWEIPYQPGELKAVAFRGGQPAGEHHLLTAEEEVHLAVQADRTEMPADSRSLAYVTVQLTDARGIPNLWEKRKVRVSVEGAGRLQGYGSADPSCEGSYQDDTWTTFDGRVMAVIRSGGEAGDIRVRFTAEGCGEVCLRIRVTDAPAR